MIKLKATGQIFLFDLQYILNQYLTAVPFWSKYYLRIFTKLSIKFLQNANS